MTFWEIAAYLLALGLALVLCRIFIKPLKGLFILVLNSLLGGVGLYIFQSHLRHNGAYHRPQCCNSRCSRNVWPAGACTADYFKACF